MPKATHHKFLYLLCRNQKSLVEGDRENGNTHGVAWRGMRCIVGHVELQCRCHGDISLGGRGNECRSTHATAALISAGSADRQHLTCSLRATTTSERQQGARMQRKPLN